MHILFLLDYYHPHLGGAETLFEHLITWLLAEWYIISLVTTKHSPDIASIEKQGNLTIYRVWSTRTNFMRYWFWKWLEILIKSKKEKKYFRLFLEKILHIDFTKNKNLSPVDLIWTTTYTAALPARLLGFFCNIKVGITVHELFGKLWFRYKTWFSAIISYLYEKYVVRLNFAAYHAVSRYTANTLRVFAGIPDDRIHMIYNGIDHKFWSIKNVDKKRVEQMKKIYGLEGKIVFMYFGHSGPSKWLDVLLDAIPYIIKNHSSVVFILNIIHASRDQEIRNKIQKIIQDLQIQEKKENDKKNFLTSKEKIQNSIILFNGLIKKDLLYKLVMSDCIIVPSLSEWFWFAAAEVSSLKKPLLVSTAGALPEVVSWFVRWINPGNIEDIITGIEEFIAIKKNWLQQWEKNIPKNTTFTYIPPKKFYWHDTIQKFIFLIETICKKSY